MLSSQLLHDGFELYKHEAFGMRIKDSAEDDKTINILKVENIDDVDDYGDNDYGDDDDEVMKVAIFSIMVNHNGSR